MKPRLVYVKERHLYAKALSLVGFDGGAVPVKPKKRNDEFEVFSETELDLTESVLEPIPSVTQILREVEEGGVRLVDFSGVPDDILTAAQYRGSLVHDCIDAEEDGDLDESLLDEEVKGYLKAYRAWRSNYFKTRNEVATYSEVGMTALFGIESEESESYRQMVAGRLDRVYVFEDGTAEVVDFKTGAPNAAARIQVGAYARMAARRLCDIRTHTYGRIVYLRKDGTYTEEEVDVIRESEKFDLVVAKWLEPSFFVDLATMGKDAVRIPPELESTLMSLEEEASRVKAEIERVKAEILIAIGGTKGVGDRYTVTMTKPTLGVDTVALQEVAPALAEKYKRVTVTLPASLWETMRDNLSEKQMEGIKEEVSVDPKVLTMLPDGDRATVEVVVRKGGAVFKKKKEGARKRQNEFNSRRA